MRENWQEFNLVLHKARLNELRRIKAYIESRIVEAREACAEANKIAIEWRQSECAHEWHADQDNYCNFCVKCGATQEIYTE